jgi:fused signal recognition particle receptor
MFKFLKKKKAARAAQETAENTVQKTAPVPQQQAPEKPSERNTTASFQAAPSPAIGDSAPAKATETATVVESARADETPSTAVKAGSDSGDKASTASGNTPQPTGQPGSQPAQSAVDSVGGTAKEEVRASATAAGKESAEAAGLEYKLDKSRAGFGKKFKQLFSVRKKIDEDLLEEIETTLLLADVGATATTEIVDKVARSVKRRQLDDPQAVSAALREHLQELARRVEKPLQIDAAKKPFVILVTGVNGVGKTTTIAKLARRFKQQGHSVMLAAGDTFRAAAVEQLKTWGEREGIPVIAQATGADSASVIFDALSAAKARGIDVLIADTAGRLHTQSNLMQELEKINRVMKKADPQAPHETLIVVDGGTGQNAIAQVREFNKAVNLTGIAVTKLDGTAKGGVLFNLAREFGLPVRFIGVGEKSSDLKTYQADEFVAALME